MEEIRIIEVKQSVFADNNADAARLRQQLKEEKTFLLNVMSSPGAGKTTLLQILKNLALGLQYTKAGIVHILNVGVTNVGHHRDSRPHRHTQIPQITVGINTRFDDCSFVILLQPQQR